MILDTIDRLPLYQSLIPDAAKIANAFLEADPSSLSFEVREKKYATKEDNARRYEVHAHTIDLMIAREGQEVVHICPRRGPARRSRRLENGWTCSGQRPCSFRRPVSGHLSRRSPHGRRASGNSLSDQQMGCKSPSALTLLDTP